jgi:hypothetical protein
MDDTLFDEDIKQAIKLFVEKMLSPQVEGMSGEQPPF